MTADDCSCVRHRATVDGAKFAEAILITNLQVGWLASILQILGALTNRTEGKEEIGSSDLGRASYRDVIFQNAFSTDDHVRTYHAVGTNLRISGDFCARRSTMAVGWIIARPTPRTSRQIIYL